MLYVSHLSKVIFCCAVYLHSVKRFSLSMLLHDHINVINRRYGVGGGGGWVSLSVCQLICSLVSNLCVTFKYDSNQCEKLRGREDIRLSKN